MSYRARSYVSKTPYKPREPRLEDLFVGEEELEIAQAFAEEIKANRNTCLECMNRLVLANFTGEKMDAITDIARKAVRFGGMTPAQHSFMASVIINKHLPKVLELIAAEVDGGTEVAPMPVEISERAREQQAAKARVEIKREAYRERQAELERLSGVAPSYETEANETYGMF